MCLKNMSRSIIVRIFKERQISETFLAYNIRIEKIWNTYQHHGHLEAAEVEKDVCASLAVDRRVEEIER